MASNDLLTRHELFAWQRTRTLEILWDPRQSVYLLAVYLLLALPFLCAGACVCMTFSRWRGMPSRIYSFDILGASFVSPAIMSL